LKKILLVLVQTVFALNAELVLERIYETEYSEAFREISTLSQSDSNICVLKGIVFVSRFDDLGDTLDLDSALSVLTKCKAGDFWEPLRRYEIGLINSILGNTIKGIKETREAALIFAEKEDLDSKAFYAIYGYYSDALTNWLPFIKSKRETYLADLRMGFEQSKMFSPIFGNSLIWILYDNKKYSDALGIANSMLEQYPKHPIFLQTRADILFKIGRVEEAVSIYRQSEALYAKRSPNSIRYWCAVANLAKMTKDNFWKEKLLSREYRLIKHWMPDGVAP
jgi:tetratricopeptide (TPR) repeat protein